VGVWGGVDLGTGSFFMELVSQRDAATLAPIIQRVILPGSTVGSDEWALGGIQSIERTRVRPPDC